MDWQGTIAPSAPIPEVVVRGTITYRLLIADGSLNRRTMRREFTAEDDNGASD